MGGGHHCFSTATVAMILMCLSRDRAQTHQKQTCSPPPIMLVRVFGNCVTFTDPVIIKETKWEIRAAESRL